MNQGHRSIATARRRASTKLIVLFASACICAALLPTSARAQVVQSNSAAASATTTKQANPDTSSLESAASKAGDTGRKVAMSMIGLALAVAAIVLAFKRDFKEAAGVLAVGLVAVLLATPAGVSLLQDTVASLVGSK